jgi:hypothetical protein
MLLIMGHIALKPTSHKTNFGSLMFGIIFVVRIGSIANTLISEHCTKDGKNIRPLIWRNITLQFGKASRSMSVGKVIQQPVGILENAGDVRVVEFSQLARFELAHIIILVWELATIKYQESYINALTFFR